MRIAEINMVDYGSTGNIMFQIADCAIERGHEVRTFSKKWRKQTPKRDYHTFYGTTLENGIHVLLFRMIGFQGLFSYFGTKQLVRELKKFNPDIIHLHNLHDSSTCLPVLFRYISKNNVKAVWTLHDCWSFTGQCPHFTMQKCERWKTKCHDCPQKTARLPIDCSEWMWKRKKQWFTGVPDMTIVTPSRWLAGLCRESFLSKYPVKVIHNGIDLSVFRPMDPGAGEKIRRSRYLVLGVALGWGERKGLDRVIELRKSLGPDYQIVLIGVDEDTRKELPAGIDAVLRTENQKQLAEYYSAADVFINPTREDTFPTTNIEAIACGTPVITTNIGGSPEMLDSSCGIIIPGGDADALAEAVKNVCENRRYKREDCVRRAQQFSGADRYLEYVNLFESLNMKQRK